MATGGHPGCCQGGPRDLRIVPSVKGGPRPRAGVAMAIAGAVAAAAVAARRRRGGRGEAAAVSRKWRRGGGGPYSTSAASVSRRWRRCRRRPQDRTTARLSPLLSRGGGGSGLRGGGDATTDGYVAPGGVWELCPIPSDGAGSATAERVEAVALQPAPPRTSLSRRRCLPTTHTGHFPRSCSAEWRRRRRRRRRPPPAGPLTACGEPTGCVYAAATATDGLPPAG